MTLSHWDLRELTATPEPVDDAKIEAFKAKIRAFDVGGHTVAAAGELWGLWRVDGGPELTFDQFMALPLSASKA